MRLLDIAPLMRTEEIKEEVLPKDLPTSVQVAGTNGKGSTCAFLSNILLQHGKKVGLYTSPHIESYTERIEINEQEISQEKLGEYVNRVNDKQAGMCQSDLLYFAACEYFKDEDVDYMVIETGLGGRRDSATLTYHEYGILTQIGLDHTEVLGDTIEQMTWEKCGIIKPGMTIISYPNERMDIIRQEAQKAKKLIETGKMHVQLQDGMFSMLDYGLTNVQLAMPGDFQVVNSICAMLCAKEMLGSRFDPDKAKRAMEKTMVFGRMSIIKDQPLILADAAHNPDGIEALTHEVDKWSGKKVAVVAINSGKDDKKMIDRLRESFDQVIFTQASERSTGPYQRDNVLPIEDSKEAIDRALSDPFDILVFCGSFDIVRRVARYFAEV